ncbi:hypothetical protein DYB38_012257 [Aphanomyces astaci]|uniref:Uncharacterized protein n=1 Tax=Aphanomyces astaci TaxID=112090 RepID=A0A397CXH4_APHAT|nr:hypothetical protein DYB38_012257 [Aphanomyces astaci]
MSDDNIIVWDAGDGFDFLPPVDDSIFAGILEGVDMSSSDSPGPPAGKPTKRRLRSQTARMEILTLHETKAELEKAVRDIARNRDDRTLGMSSSERKWEQIARNQLELKLKALRENDQLRAAVAEQHQLTKELQAIVHKKPRRMLDDDQWRVLKLSAHGEQRLAAIHLIADRQLDTVESELLTTGLIEARDPLFNVSYVQHGSDAYMQGCCCVQYRRPLHAVVNAAWKAMNHLHAHAKGSTHQPRQAYSIRIDQHTVLIRVAFQASTGPTKLESSVILKKRQLSASHVRVVFRSILDDAGHPFDADSYVSDQYGWVDVELTDDDDGLVTYKGYAKAKYVLKPRQNDANLAELRTLLESVHLDDGESFVEDKDPIKLAEEVFRTSFHGFGLLFETILAAEDDVEREDATNTQ